MEDPRLSLLEQSIIRLNHEMGQVVGELGLIKIIVGGVLATGLAQLGVLFFGK